jgi:ligand-binding sensor domain-containing protein/signal transduction histidine kinase
MNFKIKYIFLFSLFTGIISAQNSDLKFEHLSVEQGLSQSTVHSIIQDKQGLIWIATEDGLNRYDGYNFYNYGNDKEDSTSLPNNYVRTVIQDKDGNIWAGTNNGLGVLTLLEDPKNKRPKEGFINYFNDPNDSLSLSNNEIRCMYQDKFGVIWVGTSKGLNTVIMDSDSMNYSDDLGKVKFKHSAFNSVFSEATSKSFISAITEDGNGNLWFGTMGKGLMVFNRQTGQLVSYKSNSSDPGTIGSNFIIRLFTDHAGRVWVGTYAGGLNRFDNTTKSFIRYLNEPGNPNSISENRIYGLADDQNGNLWVGTFSGGINKLNLKTNLFYCYSNNEQNPFSLSNDFVRCLLIDRSGNLWAGTNNGISKTDLKPQKFTVFRNNYWDPYSLSDNFVLSMIEDNENRLWVGTNKGLDSYSEETGKFTNFRIPHNNPKSDNGFVYSIIQDENNFLWLGTFGGGLYKCDTDGRILKQYLHHDNDINGILDNRINTLFIDNNGDIVIGTVQGLCVLNKNEKSFRYHFVSSKDSSELIGKSIDKIFKDRSDIYWIGTSEGLIKIDPSDGNFTKYLHEDKPGFLSSSTITSICEDLKGNLWIGTDDGLNKFDRKTNTFTVFTTKNGLANNFIAGIIDDRDGNLWISTNHGISKFNIELPEGKQFRNYDTKDGLQGFEFTNGASFKNKNGEIYFGGTNGLNKFNPSAIRDNPNLPDVAIVAFYKLGKPDLSFLQISNTKNIILDYNENFFSFEFTAFDYTNPQKNQYAYQLEGFDKDWVYIKNRRFANYTNIDPGEYVFKVKASNNDGIWNEQGASINLIINPPFYRTWLAYFIYIIIAAVFLYLIRQYELRRRKDKNESLLKEEKEKAKLMEAQLRAEKAELQTKAFESEKELEKQIIRSRIASDLHDEIGSNLSSITLLSSLMNDNANTNSEVKKQLTDINIAAKTSTESIRDIIWFINPISDKLGSLIARMQETANMMLTGMNYKILHGEINPEEKINPELKRNLFLMFKEILNNIIKHSSANKVLIKIDKERDFLKIVIEDDGKGFNKSSIKEGNGLRNIRTRADQMNGKLEINSSPGNGTKINLDVNIT